MIVAVDNTFLSLMLNPGTKPRPNPTTGKPVEHCAQRIEALIDAHSKRNDTVLIPTPCLAELLCAVPDVARAISEIDRSVAFDVASFDTRAAIDLADVTRMAIAAGDKRAGVKADWQKVKIDRQIAAIAKSRGAEVIYTDDSSQASFAKELGLTVKHTWDLDLPPSIAQGKLWEHDDV